MSGFARRLQQGSSRPQAITGNILAKDDFNRADGSLGSSDSGTGYSSQPWSTFGTPISGSTPSWGIVGGQVQVTAPGGTNSEAIASVPVSVSAGTAFADIYLSPGSSCAALAMRISSDGSTYLNIQLNESDTYDRIALSKRVAGVTTWLAAVEPANLGPGFGYTLATVLTASGISVYVGGELQFIYTFTAQDLTDLSGATYVGMRAWYDPTDEDGGSRWDRFLVTDSTTPPIARVPAAPWNVTATNAGSGLADISWSRGGNGGSPLTGYVVTSSDTGHTFTINDPTATSFQATGLNNVAQTFTVAAVNALGNSDGTISGTVTPGAASVPGAPTSVTATVGDASAPVTWTAPASDGGAPITGYTVTSSPGNLTATSSTTSAVVTGLTNGTAYTFTVTATNSAGTGAASSPSNSVTPAAAGSYNYLANPSAYGYPDATNTGSAAKNTLTQVSGTITLTAGQTLSNTYVVGRVVLSGSSGTAPTITNCYIENSGTSPALDCSGWNGTSQPQITDTTITTTNTEAGICIMGTGANSVANFLRVDASGAQDIIHNGTSAWQDSYIHDCLRNAAGTSHADLCQLTSGGASFTHCTCHPNNGSDYQNSALEIGEQSGTVGDILFDNCLLGGGNYTLNANWNSTSPNVDTNWPVGSSFRGPHAFGSVTIQNCRFARKNGAYYPSRYGPKVHISSPPSGTYTWTNNIYDDDGSTIA